MMGEVSRRACPEFIEGPHPEELTVRAMSEPRPVSTEQPSRAGPVQSHERVEFVDILRGLAVLGILIANMFSYSGQTYSPQELAGFDRILVAVIRFLVEAKFYSLFSLLFGWGMAVQMLRAEARGTRFVPVYLRRLLILLVFGTLHGFFIWTGDILATYATYGFLLLTLRKSPKKLLLVLVGLALLLSIVLTVPGEAMDSVRGWYENITDFLRSRTYPESLYATGAYKEITRLRIQHTLSRRSHFIYTFGNIFGMFLLGLYIGKRRIFHDAREHLPLIRKVMWIGLVIGLVFNGIYIYTLLNPDWVPGEVYRLITRGARTIGAPALMIFYVSAVILLAQKEIWHERLAPLASVGRMALTNYLLQSVVCTLIFYGYGLGLYGEFGPLFGLALTIVIYLAQVRLSGWWLERFQYGPIEWVWRVLTYGRLRPHEVAHVDQEQLLEPRAPRPVAAWVRSHTALVTTWALLLLWAGTLGFWWMRVQQPSTTARPAPRATVRARATATARAVRATPAVLPLATPVTHPLVREQGAAVRSGDLWAVAMSFDEEMAFDHITELADPAYLGRRAGTEGGRAAADYIARLFAAYDLQPAGDDGGYFQEFPLDYFVALDETPTLTVIGPDGATHSAYRFRQDFTTLVGHFGGEGEAEGPVVWANTCSHDDFDDLDAVGKVMLCRDGSGEDYLRNGIEHGVAGLLLWRDPTEQPFDRIGRYRESWVPVTFPSFAVSPEVVEDLLQGTGLTLADLTIEFESVHLSTRAVLNSSLEQREAVVGRNVLGVFPGADPEHAGEVVIIGAHYDHLGRDPDGQRCPPPGEAGSCQMVPGAVWHGANDNASGVATLLEIARSWKEAGYTPDRTVLFGAWDAEEQGLWGAIHYVRQPRYPLTTTVTMIQLDMVGGEGETLAIDGPGALATKLQAMASSLEIATTVTDHGRSDHVPFRQASVPASLLIWDIENDPYYHRPSDLPQTIQPERLAAAGRLTNLTLLSLASVEPRLRDLVEEREAAIAAGNVARFLATSDADQQAADGFWWDDVQAHRLQDVNLRITDIVATRDVATATLSVSFAQEDEGIPRTVRGTVHFRRTNEGWRYAGPALAELTSERFTVAYPPDKEDLAASVLETAKTLFPALHTSTLPHLHTPSQNRLELYSKADDLRVAVSPALPLSTKAWVDGNGARLVATNDLTRTQLFTTTLTQLALAQTGMEEAQAPWLWAGLPLVGEASADPLDFQRIHLPRLQGILNEDDATPLADIPAQRDVSSSSAPPSNLNRWRAQAWAMTAYLLDQYGSDAAGRLAAALGSGLSLDAAFDQVLSISTGDFDAAWQNGWRSRLAGAEQGLQALLTARQAAVLSLGSSGRGSGDADAFLATVDPEDVTLLKEERHWFADLSKHPLQTFELGGQLLALTDDGALAVFRLRYQLAEGTERRANYEVALHLRGERWFYGGVPFEAVSSEHFVVRHPLRLATLAQALLPHLEEIYARETGDLEIVPDAPTEVKLYDQAAAFRLSIATSVSNDVNSWAEPGEAPGKAMKILVDEGGDATDYRGRLAHSFARHLLAQQGLEVDWLCEGIGRVEESRIAPQSGYLAARRILKVQRAAKNGQLLSLAELPPFEQIDSTQADLAYGAVRDAAGYLVTTHGQAALNELVRSLSEGEELNTAFGIALGMTFAEFEEAWHESAARGHVPPQWAEDALTFDGEAALAHVRELASSVYDGRESGTPGGEAAAHYVAEQFAALGLQPAGDDGTYLQHFPFTRTLSFDLSRLRLWLDGGQALSEFAYGRDFREVMVGAAGGGTAAEKLVWVRDDDYGGMDLGGKIVLRRVPGSTRLEVQKAIEHGAGGLLLVTDVQESELQRRMPLALSEIFTETIPVLEITRNSFERLVDEAGYTVADFNASPPALPLRLQAEMVVPLEPPQPTTTANVLGLIPGSDPDLADELVILSAHYDHVGRSPDGTLYPGADDDASGVGVLLEVARLWQQSGVQPSRSVLFAAWGAEEFGQLGSLHYVAHPLLPLLKIVGVLHLDAVGAGRGFFLTMEGDLTREALLRAHLEKGAAQVGGRVDFGTAVEVSDQTPFQERDVPAGLLTWDGSEDDANHPDDTPERVDPLKLTKTGRIVALTLRTLAE